MKGHGAKFERKQEEAIAALLTQRNIEEAAKAAGIAANTLLRWMKVPEFQKSYREARRAAFSQAIARLQQGTSAAATTLMKTMIDPATPASVEVRAAEAIFNHAAKAIEIEDIEARVAALEASVAGPEARSMSAAVTEDWPHDQQDAFKAAGKVWRRGWRRRASRCSSSIEFVSPDGTVEDGPVVTVPAAVSAYRGRNRRGV